mmetsp:Transcript_8818/g.14312  ORF Transcript_8818/g.14312 Transcript_8818/m.14312 type:complete len:290 (+) Transcript_8818:632-1501(+)
MTGGVDMLFNYQIGIKIEHDVENKKQSDQDEFGTYMEKLEEQEEALRPNFQKDLVDPEKVRAEADYHGWKEVETRQPSMISFIRDGDRFNLYFTTGTVGTCIKHPTKGDTQLFRRNCRLEEVKALLENVRMRTSKGYYTKAQFDKMRKAVGKYSKRKRAREGDDDMKEERSSAKRVKKDSCPNINVCTGKDCPYGHSCRFGSKCANTSCAYNHHCRFGASCVNDKCWFIHSCKFGRDCFKFGSSEGCRFVHPCRFGDNCTDPDCRFDHVAGICSFGAKCIVLADCRMKH